VYTGFITVRSTDGKNNNNGEVYGAEAHFPLVYGDYQIHISNQVGTKDDKFSLHVPSLDLTYDCKDYQPKNPPQATLKQARDEALRGWWFETGQIGGKGRDYDSAMRWYLKAVEDGDAQANWNIGRLYEFGFGLPKDLTAAKTWYQKAADKGVLEAQDSLANLGHNKDY
jgi:TPR repeat protein